MKYDAQFWSKPYVPYEREQLWFPLSSVVAYWDDDFYQLMLHDALRMTTYKKAIEFVLREIAESRRNVGSHGDERLAVLDLGTGYGVLAQWVVEIWRTLRIANRDLPAVRVYAIEANARTFEVARQRFLEEGMLDQEIRLLNCSSYELQPAGAADTSARHDRRVPQFDLIVCELFGNLVDNEDMTAILAHACGRFLKPGGRVIPRSAVSFLAPVSSLVLHDQLIESRHSVISKHYERLSGYEPRKITLYDAIIPHSCMLASAQRVQEWIFENVSSIRTQYEVELTFKMDRSAPLTGFKGYFHAELADGVTFSLESDDIEARQTSDCLKHAYLPIGTPLDVNQGDRLALTFSRSAPPPSGRALFQESPTFDLSFQPHAEYLWTGQLFSRRAARTLRTGHFQHNAVQPRPFYPASAPPWTAMPFSGMVAAARERDYTGRFLQACRKRVLNFLKQIAEADARRLRCAVVSFPFASAKPVDARLGDLLNGSVDTRSSGTTPPDSWTVSYRVGGNQGRKDQVDLSWGPSRERIEEACAFESTLCLPGGAWQQFLPHELQELALTFLQFQTMVIVDLDAQLSAAEGLMVFMTHETNTWSLEIGALGGDKTLIKLAEEAAAMTRDAPLFFSVPPKPRMISTIAEFRTELIDFIRHAHLNVCFDEDSAFVLLSAPETVDVRIKYFVIEQVRTAAKRKRSDQSLRVSVQLDSSHHKTPRLTVKTGLLSISPGMEQEWIRRLRQEIESPALADRNTKGLWFISQLANQLNGTISFDLEPFAGDEIGHMLVFRYEGPFHLRPT